MWAFARGGNAVDAAIAANAAHRRHRPAPVRHGRRPVRPRATPGGDVVGLNASGRAGVGADAAALRDEGHAAMPFRHDVRTRDGPGLRRRLGGAARALRRCSISTTSLGAGDPPRRRRLPGQAVARPRRHVPRRRAPARAARARRPGGAAGRARPPAGRGPDAAGDRPRRPRRVLRRGVRRGARASRRRAVRREPTSTSARPSGSTCLSHRRVRRRAVLAAAELAGLPDAGPRRLAADAGLPADPDDGSWAHLLVEAAIAAAYDRPERAPRGRRRRRARRRRHRDAARLLDIVRVGGRAADPDVRRRHDVPVHGRRRRVGGQPDPVQRVRASARGSSSRRPAINLHNRGLGFSLARGPPGRAGTAAAGRRTRCAPRSCDATAQVAAVLGTMGGDAQPQILAQLVARLFHADQPPGDGRRRAALGAPRAGDRVRHVDDGARRRRWSSRTARHPAGWTGCVERGHDVAAPGRSTAPPATPTPSSSKPNGTFCAAADPRALISAAAAL